MNELYELTERQVAGEATLEEQTRLRDLLQDKAARAMYVRHVTLMATMRGICKAIDQEASEVRSMQGPAPIRRTMRWYPRLLALAASLVVVAGGVWWLNRPQAVSLALRVAEMRGQVSGFRVQGSGGKNIQHPTANAQHPSGASGVLSPTVLRPGDMLHPGEGVSVGADGYAKLAYPDGTHIDLHGSTRLRVLRGAGWHKDTKRLALEGGLLVCAVAPQKQPFRLETAHGVAEVVGTRFTLAENRDQATLAVQDGRVDLHQKDQRLEVRAGETAVSAAAGLRKLVPADAWLQALLIRAETGPWDVVKLGEGVYSNDVWRMDGRRGPAERRIWNVQAYADKGCLVNFSDGQRWSRGVVVGRVMVLPEGETTPEVDGGGKTAPACWQTRRGGVENVRKGFTGDYQNIRQACVTITGDTQKKWIILAVPILDARACRAGAWYRYAVYFDAAAPAQGRVICATWPDEQGAPLAASAWVSKHGNDLGSNGIEVGLSVQGILMVVQGLKVVPLGAELPPPPQKWLDEK
jgi:ferric-dicitrate binding protein FerR (iron transport regulator)